ncbi:MAG: acyl carrier protein [Bifidobacteriaceae bacterium]|jgi:acyl carrier protein|nr:acyl carrier protein [Bifidobacteriaceae bacterium]
MALDKSEVLAGLTEIIVDETGLPAESVAPGKSFVDDLDVDSLSMMTIVTLAEDKFSVRIPDEAVKDLTTVGEAVEYIVAAEAPH